jgi:hypothetical protein
MMLGLCSVVPDGLEEYVFTFKWHTVLFLDCLTLEDKGNTILQNVRSNSSNYTVLYPTGLKYLTTLL